MRPLTIERHPTNELSQSNSMNSQATIQSTAAAPCAIHRSYLTPLKFQQFGVDKLSELPRCLFVCPQCAAQVIRKLDAALGLADFHACAKKHVAALLALKYLVGDGHHIECVLLRVGCDVKPGQMVTLNNGRPASSYGRCWGIASHLARAVSFVAS